MRLTLKDSIATSTTAPTFHRRGNEEEGEKGIRPLQENVKKKENMKILKSPRKQSMKMMQMTSRLMSSTVRVEW